MRSPATGCERPARDNERSGVMKAKYHAPLLSAIVRRGFMEKMRLSFEKNVRDCDDHPRVCSIRTPLVLSYSSHSLRTRLTRRGGENQSRAETAEHAERSSRESLRTLTQRFI